MYLTALDSYVVKAVAETAALVKHRLRALQKIVTTSDLLICIYGHRLIAYLMNNYRDHSSGHTCDRCLHFTYIIL